MMKSGAQSIYIAALLDVNHISFNYLDSKGQGLWDLLSSCSGLQAGLTRDPTRSSHAVSRLGMHGPVSHC